MAVVNFLPLFVWISVLSAQITGNYAPCATSCVITATSPSCGDLDTICFCSSLPYLKTVALCIKKSCSPQDYQSSTSQITTTCAKVGVTINFSDILATSISASTSTGGTTSPVSTFNTVTSTSTLTSTTSSSVLQSGTSNPSAVATFTGGTLLTGACTIPQFTSTLTAGTVTEFPQIGCASNNLGCCPLNSSVLASCPADYTTTSLACCPSGWSIYSTSLGGATPCYSSLLIPVSEPTASLISSNVPSAPIYTMTIFDHVFTDKFALQLSTSSGIGETAKVGIGVGVGVGAGLVALLIFGFFLLKRTRLSKDLQGSPKRQVRIISKPELDGIALQELESSRGPGRRIELQDTVHELEP